MIDKIRHLALNEEFDYTFLMACLSDYKNPRDKITRLLKSGDIIRVKKGLYIFGSKYRERPFSKEVLANLIYGPSYISLDYALFLYQMIPERIETVTNITCKRNKFFKTPIGNFSYTYLNQKKYYIGIKQTQMDKNRNILIATREKALSDKVSSIKDLENTDDMRAYLLENLRIDKDSLKKLNISKLRKISDLYNNKSIRLLFNTIKEIK